MASWLFRSNPHGVDRLNEFFEKGFIAIGWPILDDLFGKSREEIKKLLAERMGLQGRSLGNNLAVIDAFVNKFSVGDYVVIPHGEEIHIAEIEGPYNYVPSCKGDGYPHQRKVRFLKSLLRDSLPKDLRSSLIQLTIASLSHHQDKIDKLLSGDVLAKEEIVVDEQYLYAEFEDLIERLTEVALGKQEGINRSIAFKIAGVLRQLQEDYLLENMPQIVTRRKTRE